MGLAALAGVAGHPAQAGGGREPEPSTSHDIDTTPKKTSKKLDVIYTQKYLKNVKTKDLRTALKANKTGHSVVVEGFSKSGSNMIFEMLLLDSKTTLKILNELKNKTKRADRRGVLNIHYENAHEGYAYWQNEVGGREDAKEGLQAIQDWLKLIRKWTRTPMEGAKVSKKAKTN